jgi:integrase
MARPGGKDRGLFQKNDTWWIRWTCRYGHEHREKGGSKSLARQLYQTRKTDVRHNGFCLSEARARVKREEGSSFDKVSERYLQWAREHRSPSTKYREVAIKRLTESFGGRHLGDITAQDIERHQKRRQAEGLKPATVNRERSVLSHMFTMAMKWGLVERNPVRDTDAFKENNVKPRPLTLEEERRLFAVLPQHYKPFVTFALNMGLQMGEIQSQRWSDVDMENSVLTVTKPKSGKHERIPLNTTAYTILVAADQSGELVFPRMPKHMSGLFKRYARKAGVDTSFHDLRDTYISRLAVSANPTILMKLARHRNFATTMRYLGFDDDHLRDAVESIVPHRNGDQIGTGSGTEVFIDSQHIDYPVVNSIAYPYLYRMDCMNVDATV